MNRLKAKITDIKNVDELNIVSFEFLDQNLSMVSLELDENIKVGVEVYLSCKATHIAIAKEFIGELSYSNQIKAKISNINNGKILTSIIANIATTSLESVITLSSSKRMNLQIGDEIILLIKASELSILETLI